MRLASRIRTWWKAVTHPQQLNGEVEDELAFHMESYAEDLMRNGMPREEAFRRARIELGGIAQQKENIRTAWGTRVWDELRSDLRYAFRMLAKSPGFTAIAIGSLALGIGANTIIFTVTKAILLDKLAVHNPEQLRLLAWIDDGSDKNIIHSSWGEWEHLPSGRTICTSFSYPVYQQLRKQNRSLKDLFAFKDVGRLTATIDDKAEAVKAEMISGNYYSQLGVKPVLGRPIVEGDDGIAGSGPVVLISDAYWSRRFGRSPEVIGKKIEINSTPMMIIGVNPPGFTGAFGVQESPDVFLPFSMQPIAAPKGKSSLLTDTELWWVLVMGRLRPGVSESTARASLDVALNAAVRATTTVGKDDEIPAMELEDGSRGENSAGRQFAKPIYVLISLSGFVLLLACANLANLLLARSSARQREMSVRLALGAGRARILRQMFTESLLLSITGGAAGLLLGYTGRNAIPHLLSSSWEPTMMNSRFDWTIFGYTVAISLFTGLLFGLAPAWQSTRTQVSSGLKDNAQTATQRRRNIAGKTIVIVQITLSMLLLVGAGLFVRTLMNLSNSHLGFRPDNILLFELQPALTRYPGTANILLHHRLEEKLAAVQGVDSLTLSEMALIANRAANTSITVPGQPQTKHHLSAFYNSVGEHFFTTLGIPVIAGRGFNDTDTEISRKVAVINQQMATKFFPDANPVGKIFDTGSGDDLQHIEVVGICKDAKYDSLRRESPPTFYMPYRQQADIEGGMTYEIHTRVKPEIIVPALRSVVQSVDRDLPLLAIRTQVEQIEDNTREERIFASLTSGFGLLALVLACIGIYGIMAYTVSRRTNEIGIRMALGAQSGRVLRMIMGEAWWLAFVGVIVGLGIALPMSRLIASMLYGLKPYDPFTLIGAAMLLVFVALAASWIPARRAASVNPIKALRHE